MSLRGCDISFWQSTTPPLDGLSFVIARACYGTIPDVRYPMHEANVRKAGLPLGAYCFGVNGHGAAQAKALLKLAPSADFYVLDLEADGPNPSMTDAQARAFITAMHAAGRRVGLYHSLSGFPSLGQDWNWVAAWDGIVPNIPWTFHQTGGSPLDQDVFAGDATALAAFIAAQRITMTPKPLTPSAEPVAYAGLITSLILAGIQYATGHGLITGDQAVAWTSQSALIANGIISMLPFLIALVTRQTVTPNGSVPPVVIPSQPPVVVSPPSSPPAPAGLTVISSAPLAAGTEGTIGAATRRWLLDGTFKGEIGPSTLVLASLDFLSGPINGHFYRAATAPPVYIEARDVSLLSATNATVTIAAPSVVISTPPVSTSPGSATVKPASIDLSARSTDSYWYMRQLLALESNPDLLGTLKGIWPREATDQIERERRNAEFVGSYLASGPYYNHDVTGAPYPPLPNADIILAHQFAPNDLNPVVRAALDAATVEAQANPSGVVDLGTDTTLRIINLPGAWGVIPVSGRFGTVDVLGM